VLLPILAASSSSSSSSTTTATATATTGSLAALVASMRAMKVGPPSGLLLHGPPGTGKTALARSLAAAAGLTLLHVACPRILSRYVGDSEAAVRAVFAAARRLAPCALLLDDIDTVAGVRAGLAVGVGSGDGKSGDPGSSGGGGGGGGGASTVLDRILATLLNEMDGVGQRAKEGGGARGAVADGVSAASSQPPPREQPLVLVIGTSSRAAHLDAALLRAGRLEVRELVPLPGHDDRLAILEASAAGVALAPDGRAALLALASSSEGRTCAQLAHIVSESGLAALAAGKGEIGAEDVGRAARAALGGAAKGL
jgi:ATP-dependent 26S proteasome regulatory subunit